MADNFTDSASLSPDPGLGLMDETESQADETDGQDEADDQAERERKEQILEDAKKRFQLAVEAENDIRRLALEDLEFRAGKQWPEDVVQDRERDGRPCLVINRIPQFVQQITNDQRQNRPSIKVHPVDDGADEETAKIIQGIIRHIEYNSNAEVAIDTAFEGAATGGFGYFRIVTDYADPLSFDQEIYFKRIRNPFNVFFDPYSQEPDGSDAGFAFIVENLSPEEYKAQFPESELATREDWESIGNQVPGWMPNGSARVAEYFYKDFKEVTLCQLRDGTVIDKAKVEEYAASLALKAAASVPPGQPAPPITIEIIRERQTKVPVIKWCKLNAVEVLEETEWVGKYIPIIPVYGQELDIDGKRVLEGIIRNAKDPQRMYNYWKSAETEAIALAPRAPFVAAEGQLEGYESEWATANKRNRAYLTYKPTTIQGIQVPPPQRMAVEPAVQAITAASMQAADDLKATTGIYDPSLGAGPADTSGIAIQKRNIQAQTSNFHFVDNLTRSLRHAGRILVDLIPRIYDTARAARIIGDDGTQKVVQINVEHLDPETGKPVLYDLSAGRYDVTVDVGPSYASKRQEAATSMQSLAQSYPQIMSVAGDLFVKNMDWPGAQEIAERLKKTLPPQLQDQGQMKDVPPQVQAQMQQMQQLIQGLTQHLNEKTQMLEQKTVDKQADLEKTKMELEHRERVELMKLQTEAEIQMAKMGSVESMALLQAKLTEMDHQLKYLKINQPIQMPTEFEAAMQALSQPPQAPQDMSQPGQSGMGQPPTGGASPGQTMEGQPSQ